MQAKLENNYNQYGSKTTIKLQTKDRYNETTDITKENTNL